jgi:MinD superfamily P-loop ATPase
MTEREMSKATAVRIDETVCRRCGSCAKACPSGNIAWPDRERSPAIGKRCTGCWACYNACPHSAIRGWATPPGKGRYSGPSHSTKSLFEDPR